MFFHKRHLSGFRNFSTTYLAYLASNRQNDENAMNYEADTF